MEFVYERLIRLRYQSIILLIFIVYKGNITVFSDILLSALMIFQLFQWPMNEKISTAILEGR